MVPNPGVNFTDRKLNPEIYPGFRTTGTASYVGILPSTTQGFSKRCFLKCTFHFFKILLLRGLDYYRWLHILLIIGGLLCLLPSHLWKSSEANRAFMILRNVTLPNDNDDTETRATRYTFT